MNIKELLNKELSFEEMNEILNELMDFGCNAPEDSRMKPLNTLSGILLLKEKIDEERGEWRGRTTVQQSIKQALGID